MASKKKDKKTALLSTNETIAENRRARYEYTLEDKFEAGIMLTGTEVPNTATSLKKQWGMKTLRSAYTRTR